MVVQALDKTTIEMRDRYREGDEFLDFAGPLGLPKHIKRVGHLVLVGAVSALRRFIRSFGHSRKPGAGPPGSSDSEVGT